MKYNIKKGDQVFIIKKGSGYKSYFRRHPHLKEFKILKITEIGKSYFFINNTYFNSEFKSKDYIKNEFICEVFPIKYLNKLVKILYGMEE